MNGSAILAAFRTPVVPRGGAFATLDIHDLAAPVLRRCLSAGGIDAADIEEVICANALGAGGNPARLVAQAAGLPERVGGLSIDRQCAGGLDAILLGDALIRAGAARFVLAGGAESHSRRPLRAHGRTDAPEFYDRPAFSAPGFADPDLADAAAALARAEGLSRARMDAFAVDSHAKARAANLLAEIVPLAGLDRDAFTRDLTPALALRAPRVSGDLSTATTAIAADAAAFVLLGPADDFPHTPRVLGGRTLGADPVQPGLAPLAAIRATLADHALSPVDLAVIEVMEAYASQAMATIAQAGLDPKLVNRGGGGLARGHPIGASGAINAVRLVHELRRTPGIGMASIAAAGGLGTALALAL